jgi:tetratricopeptide (TPR) repeat protein
MLRPPDNLPDDQIEVWQQALEYFHQAYRLQREGDWAGAIQAYQRSIRLYPTAEAHTFLGWVYSFLHLYGEAIAECQRAIEVDADFGNPYNDIGAYLIEQDRLEEAIPWFEKAIAAPRYEARSYPHFNLGRVYEKLGHWLAAIDHFQRAVEIRPDHSEARGAYHALRAKLN